ncbi:MAG: type II toxin-antitoxin system RelB/DinJ family antitoxin [Succinivibrio sp.]|nr:type II toxin-antitoxin system RelB/DinJ family antitoxin [Succinivibrio sp.]
MTKTAARTAAVQVRVDPAIKEQALDLLRQQGIPLSHALGLFLEQVVMQHGLPFAVNLPAHVRPVADAVTGKEQLHAEIQKVMADIEAGRIMDAYEVEAELRTLYGA